MAGSHVTAEQRFDWRFCVAPMLDWTDRHCRFFHRQLSRRARLYSEMVTSGALLHGDLVHHLDFDAQEHPLALQVGGSDPAQLAGVARLAANWGYDEINLNCGCPSERVQRGAFGACLMEQPNVVAVAVRALQGGGLPVTVKHRIGIDRRDDYGFVRDFVGSVADAGCRVFIVHARAAWLQGLSPKENREVPPLDYAVVRQLRRDFPQASFVLNGGLMNLDDALRELSAVDGVMIGRAAYHDPYLLAGVDRDVFGASAVPVTRLEVIGRMSVYLQQQTARGVAPRHIVRHMLGLFQGQRGARQWRRYLSDAATLARDGPLVLVRALESMSTPAGQWADAA